jgi:hypothetical protein
VLDLFGNLDQLGESRTHLFEAGGMVLLDLLSHP